MDAKKVGSFLKELRDENLSIVLEDLQQENQRFEKKMLCVLAITTFLAITIIFLLPLKSVKDIAILVMVVAIAFISNTLNIVALALKKDNSGLGRD